MVSLLLKPIPMMTALWILTVVVGPVLILTLAGVVYQAVGAALDARRYPPRGRLVVVDGRRAHIHVSGEGGPTVVLESGMGASTLSWSLVEPLMAQFARVVSYDRASTGWSDLARTPRTADAIAEELHTLLTEAGIAGPYVLV